MVNDRDDLLAGRLGTPLPSERAAAERNWQALSVGMTADGHARTGWLRALATGLALAAAVVVGLGWWQGARIEVAGDGIPVLYREEIARTAVTATGIEGTLAIQQKHIDGDPRLRVVALTDVRLGADRLPAVIELRFQRPGDDSYGLLARSEVSDPRRATGTTRTLYEAPFPPLGSREHATFRVWLHLETAGGTSESEVLVIEVTERAEGQRAINAGR